MSTTKNREHEQTLRQAFHTMDAHQAQGIREAYYKAVEGLQTLVEMLKITNLDASDRNNHPLIEEHLIACSAMETMKKSLLGRAL